MLDLDRKGTSGIKGLVCVIPPLVLFMKCIGAMEFAQFVILVSLFAAPGIFCDSSDS